MSKKLSVNIRIEKCSHCPNFNFTGNGDGESNYCDHPKAGNSFSIGNDFIPIECPRNERLISSLGKIEPIVVLVNGFPTAGKDTFCDFARAVGYETTNYSTVDTVKDIATTMGWTGLKSPDARNMLSALKDFYVEWFDGTFCEIVDLIIQKYHEGDDQFIFLHTREPEEIKRVVEWCTSTNKKYYSVFIEREVEMKHGNHADSNVTDFDYDIYIQNDGTLIGFQQKSLDIFRKMVDNKI